VSVTSHPRRLPARYSCLAVVLLLACAALHAAERKSVPNTTRPEERTDATAVARHRHLLGLARKGDVQVLFLGDSITRRWEEAGREAWDEHFAPLRAANFGVGGDGTQHVLWRITAGKELEGLHPRACVLLIGTNNLATNSAPETADGIKAIVRELRRQQPDMHILLLGLFPRGARASDPLRGKVKEVNREVARLDGDKVHYLDIGDRFLEPDGSLSKDVMPDYLHPGKKGFQIWANALLPKLKEVLRNEPLRW
jgi:lysophospholipase L1-like esterase